MSAAEALLFGITLSAGGGFYLLISVNRLSAALAISTLLSYLLIYTPLKRKTPLCTMLGAVPGAMPTLIGWAGASGKLEPHAWFLFAVLFLWQFPHFLAIALMYREDYSRAGYRMLPAFDRDAWFTRAEILGFAVVLVIVTLWPIGHPLNWYSASMYLAGAFLLYHAGKLLRVNSTRAARDLLHASVFYLPIVLGIMAAGK